MKGKAQPVPIYHPLGKRNRSSLLVSAQSRDSLIGREAEIEILNFELERLARGEPGGLLVIEGVTGMGKSRLLDELRRQAYTRHVTVLSGSADLVARSTEYNAWRSIYDQLFDLAVLTQPDARRQHILALLELEPELLELAPLLSKILRLNLPDNETTARLEGQARAEATRDLLIKALQASCARSPKVLILDDAQWLDSASWALAWLVRQQVQPLLLVIASHPMTEEEESRRWYYRQLLQLPETNRMQLQLLKPEETVRLVCQRLGVVSLPEVVVDLVYERAQGHPFFTEELVEVLRDSGVLHITADKEGRLAPGVTDLSTLRLPDSIELVTIRRIDQLTPPQQLTLKTASAIGRNFSFNLLRAIYPLENDRECLPDYLTSLEHQDITNLETREPELNYLFKHVTTQKVAYNLMLFSQRRQLHRAVAEWYERTYAQDLTPYFPLLVYHWDMAEEKERALNYLEKAGLEALRSGTYQEAVRFFREALKLADAQNVSQNRRAYWQQKQTEAQAGLEDAVVNR